MAGQRIAEAQWMGISIDCIVHSHDDGGVLLMHLFTVGILSLVLVPNVVTALPTKGPIFIFTFSYRSLQGLA